MIVAVCQSCPLRWDVADIGGILPQQWLNVTIEAIDHWKRGHKVCATREALPRIERVARIIAADSRQSGSGLARF